MCLQYDFESKMLAAGLRNGGILVYNTAHGELETQVDKVDESKKLLEMAQIDVNFPVTCLKWKPRRSTDRIYSLLFAAYGNGTVKLWDIFNKQVQYEFKEPENSGVYTVDCNASGTEVLTGGVDATLRVYDLKTQKLSVKFSPGLHNTVHHFNRIH